MITPSTRAPTPDPSPRAARGRGDAPVLRVGMERSTSQIAKPVLRPALAHALLIFQCWTHGRRKALAAPFWPARILPRPGRVDQHAIPQASAELRDVAIFHWCRG